MIRVRICTSRCRCHSSCRRSRFSRLGTQILGKLSSRISRSKSRASKFCQQSLEPARESGSFHAYPHQDSSLVQVPIESFCFSLTVVQLPFAVLTGLFHPKCNLLKARVIIHAYNHHVRLLPPEPLVVSNQSLLGSRESALLCNQMGPAILFAFRKVQFSNAKCRSQQPRSIPIVDRRGARRSQSLPPRFLAMPRSGRVASDHFSFVKAQLRLASHTGGRE